MNDVGMLTGWGSEENRRNSRNPIQSEGKKHAKVSENLLALARAPLYNAVELQGKKRQYQSTIIAVGVLGVVSPTS